MQNKQGARKAAPTKPRARSAVAKRSNYNKWHNNPALSDITVVYGLNGERKYTGHRLVFCNASQWFANASKESFLVSLSDQQRKDYLLKCTHEANEKEVQLKLDDADALEAFFEFAYKDNYTVPEHGDTPTEVAKNQFMFHIRAYVIADKYMAENLVEFALQNVEYVVKTQVDNNNLDFYKFAVKIVYEENIFEHEEEFFEEEAAIDPKQEEDGVVENGEVKRDGEEERLSDAENAEVAANEDKQSKYEGDYLE